MLANILLVLPHNCLLLSKPTNCCREFPDNFIDDCLRFGATTLIRTHKSLLDSQQVITSIIQHRQFELLDIYSDVQEYGELLHMLLDENNIRDATVYCGPNIIKQMFRLACSNNNITALDYLCSTYTSLISECNPVRYSVKYCKSSSTTIVIKHFKPTIKHIDYRSKSKYYIAPHVLVCANPRLIRYYYVHIFAFLGTITLIAVCYVIVYLIFEAK